MIIPMLFYDVSEKEKRFILLRFGESIDWWGDMAFRVPWMDGCMHEALVRRLACGTSNGLLL